MKKVYGDRLFMATPTNQISRDDSPSILLQFMHVTSQAKVVVPRYVLKTATIGSTANAEKDTRNQQRIQNSVSKVYRMFIYAHLVTETSKRKWMDEDANIVWDVMPSFTN